MEEKTVFAALAEQYPLLYLNPDEDTQETYRRVVLQGAQPEKKSLAHYTSDPGDRNEILETPAGPVRAVTLGNRRDFELVMRGLLAAKAGPLAPIPESQGAAMVTVFNWPRIHAYLAGFPAQEQNAAFKRFTAVRENYIDMLVVLSRGPYSHVPASLVGHTQEEWLALSDTIRRYHELTHVICRRLYPDRIAPVRDELVADAVGLYAAYGHFDPDPELLILGIRDGAYVGGRLENYVDDPENHVVYITQELERIKACIDAHPGTAPFDLIPALMET